jgi:hypothetical protein
VPRIRAAAGPDGSPPLIAAVDNSVQPFQPPCPVAPAGLRVSVHGSRATKVLSGAPR